MSPKCPPILLITYRRPETTRQVFEAIRKARPAKLFVSQEALSDDKRDQKGFAERHAEVRKIVTQVDWPCELHTLFFDTHQGIINGFQKSLNWFFENVEEGVMIEDDEIPDPTFFPWAAEMLEKYRHDDRVMSISGSNVLEHYKLPYQENSYYFLSIPSVWGMGTWRRAWKHYDPYLKRWPEVRDSKLLYDVLPTSAAAFYFSNKFQGYYDRTTNSWDGQWVFACMANRGLSIYPTENLIMNIGFNDVHAFHGVLADSLWENLPTEPLTFPLRHPPEVAVNKVWDEYGVSVRYLKSNLTQFQKVKWFFESHFPDLYIAGKKIYHKLFGAKKYANHDYAKERSLLP